MFWGCCFFFPITTLLVPRGEPSKKKLPEKMETHEKKMNSNNKRAEHDCGALNGTAGLGF